MTDAKSMKAKKSFCRIARLLQHLNLATTRSSGGNTGFAGLVFVKFSGQMYDGLASDS
jgi:hypothetical protein